MRIRKQFTIFIFTAFTALLLAAYACSKQAPANGDDFEMDAATLVKYRGKAENVTIPSGVTSIGDYAFDYYELKTIMISKRTKIRTSTFRNAQITYID